MSLISVFVWLDIEEKTCSYFASPDTKCHNKWNKKSTRKALQKKYSLKINLQRFKELRSCILHHQTAHSRATRDLWPCAALSSCGYAISITLQHERLWLQLCLEYKTRPIQYRQNQVRESWFMMLLQGEAGQSTTLVQQQRQRLDKDKHI